MKQMSKQLLDCCWIKDDKSQDELSSCLQLLPGPSKGRGTAAELRPAKGHHQHPTEVSEAVPAGAAFASRSCNLSAVAAVAAVATVAAVA